MVAGAALHAISVGAAPCSLIGALAVAQCGVRQHHLDGQCQCKLTLLLQEMDERSQNEQQGDTYGDDRDRRAEKQDSSQEPQEFSDALRRNYSR